MAEIAELHIPAPFGWVGGKRQLSKRIVSLMPPHKVYVEPFCGAASVFWAKEPSEVEVLNDIDPDLMRFYRDIGSVKTCEVAAISEDWDRLKAKEGNLKPCELLSEVLCSFGDKREGKILLKGREEEGKCSENAPQFHRYLPQYQARLKETKLHNEDWQKVTRLYDSPDTFFYLDPPYHGTSRGYKYGEDQLARLAETLPALKGKWILSYDDDPDVRGAFAPFHIVPVTSRYTLKAGSNKTIGKQLLIANYPLDKGKLAEGDITPMLKYQYATMLDQLILLQLHAEDPNCPCSLQGTSPGELGEFCEPKHLRAVVALARETLAMDDDEARAGYLEGLVREGTELLTKMEEKLCGKEVEMGEYATWARDKRKPLEAWCYSGFCMVAPVEDKIKSFLKQYEVCEEIELCHKVDASSKGEAVEMAKDRGEAGADTKLVKDWTAKLAEYIRSKESEMGNAQEVKLSTGEWAVVMQALFNVKTTDLQQADAYRAVADKINKQLLAQESPKTSPSKEAEMEQPNTIPLKFVTESASRTRMLSALRDYRKNKGELEMYFDYGEDTDRIQSKYNTSWLEAGILGFAMRLDWTPSDLVNELDWVCGIGSEPQYKGASLHPIVKEAPMGKEKYHYARRLPKEVDVYSNVIHKHYVDWKKDIHEGSIRVVKPTPEVLVYLGCLLKDKWDEASVTCSPNPTVVKTITPNTKKYLDELEHLKFVHPEIKVNYHKEVSVEPRVGEEAEGAIIGAIIIEEKGEAHSIEKALKEIRA